jgi:hypothetical protein
MPDQQCFSLYYTLPWLLSESDEKSQHSISYGCLRLQVRVTLGGGVEFRKALGALPAREMFPWKHNKDPNHRSQEHSKGPVPFAGC